MQYNKWIMSEGGPLILIDTESACCWGGVLSKRLTDHAYENDYEKACETNGYLIVFEIAGSPFLIVGDEPLDTCFWCSPDGVIFIVRVWACEEDFDIDAAMQNLPPDLFDSPEETVKFMVKRPNFIMFDSAEPGDDPDMKVVKVTLATGTYRILTQTYKPDVSTTLILHRFDRLA